MPFPVGSLLGCGFFHDPEFQFCMVALSPQRTCSTRIRSPCGFLNSRGGLRFLGTLPFVILCFYSCEFCEASLSSPFEGSLQREPLPVQIVTTNSRIGFKMRSSLRHIICYHRNCSTGNLCCVVVTPRAVLGCFNLRGTYQWRIFLQYLLTLFFRSSLLLLPTS